MKNSTSADIEVLFIFLLAGNAFRFSSDWLEAIAVLWNPALRPLR